MIITGSNFICPEFVGSFLAALYDHVGLNYLGSPEHAGVEFPKDGDETATYRNKVFVVRHSYEGDYDPYDSTAEIPEEIPAFEHFATGLKLYMSEGIGRRIYSNMPVENPLAFMTMINECVSSVPKDHDRGRPAPDIVGTIVAHEFSTTSSNTEMARVTIRRRDGGEVHLVAFDSAVAYIRRLIKTAPQDDAGFRVRAAPVRANRRLRDVIYDVYLPERVKTPFEA
ncbi:MAG: hypothetical protein K2X45_19265 [Phreatobacter sp.]|nr:hypothetical protein [Phreatobacter sp.]